MFESSCSGTVLTLCGGGNLHKIHLVIYKNSALEVGKSEYRSDPTDNETLIW
jgi:hypothetical protein